MFIQTEATPNPATLKFLPGKPVLPGGTRDYRDAEAATESPLAQKLFGVPGVSGVFLGQDFITVSKSSAEWQHLKPSILGLIMDHYLSGAPMLLGEKPADAGGEEFLAAGGAGGEDGAAAGGGEAAVTVIAKCGVAAAPVCRLRLAAPQIV
jgi:hypothetical protein